MKIEFLAGGSPDCPLVRIYDFNSLAARRLHTAVCALSSGTAQSIAFHELPEIEMVDGCRITAQLSDTDWGVLPNAKESNSFVWMLKASTWDDIAGLIEPFRRSETNGFQWLDQTSNISVLLSPRGTW